MKTTPLKLSSLILLMTLQYIAHADEYCESGSDGNQLIWIESIYSGPFANESGQIRFVQNDQDYLYLAYWDYTNLSMDWEVGSNSLELQPGLLINSIPVQWQVWIDLNTDNNFSPDELMAVQTGGNLPVNLEIDLSDLSITEPFSTRMRISASYYENAPPCGSIGHGEVEDYQVVITPQTQNTLRVPEEYASIQDAVDAALPGDRVLVSDGVYFEQTVINKPLLVESENGAALTQIFGQVNHMSFEVKSPDVSIKGFGFTGAYGWRYAGIYFSPGSHRGQAIDNSCFIQPGTQRNDVGVLIRESNEVVVSGFDCEADGTAFAGIWVENSDNSHFFNNTLSSQAWYGMYISESNHLLIENNTMNQNTRAGLHILRSSQLTISQNTFFANTEPDFHNYSGNGIVIDDSSEITVEANQFRENSNRGLMLVDSNDIQVIENEFYLNDIGLFSGATDSLLLNGNLFTRKQGAYIKYGVNSIVRNNIFELTTGTALYLQSHHNGQFSNNHFLNNRGSISLSQSNDNVFVNNIVKPKLNDYNRCAISISNSNSNRLYLNDFIFNHNSGICGYNSSTHLTSLDPINYKFDNQLRQNYLGNFYHSDNQLDEDGDGVVDYDVLIDDGELIDEHSLSIEFVNYEVLD